MLTQVFPGYGFYKRMNGDIRIGRTTSEYGTAEQILHSLAPSGYGKAEHQADTARPSIKRDAGNKSAGNKSAGNKSAGNNSDAGNFNTAAYDIIKIIKYC